MGIKLEAPGTIEHLGWVHSPGHPSEYIVEWYYRHENGREYALRELAYLFENVTPEELEEQLITVVNRHYNNGVLFPWQEIHPDVIIPDHPYPWMD